MRPGVVSKDSEGKITCKPIRSKIVTLLAEKNQLQFAVPGGLIGVGTRASFSSLPCSRSLAVCVSVFLTLTILYLRAYFVACSRESLSVTY